MNFPKRADQLAPILEPIWSDLHTARRAESGRWFIGLIVPAKPWVLWDKGEEQLRCERCGATEGMKTPLGVGSALLEALAERLTPWLAHHSVCKRKVIES